MTSFIEKEQEKIKNLGVNVPIYGITKLSKPETTPCDQCPQCNTSMDEEWEGEINEIGVLTGFTFEIYSCGKCGFTEPI